MVDEEMKTPAEEPAEAIEEPAAEPETKAEEPAAEEPKSEEPFFTDGGEKKETGAKVSDDEATRRVMGVLSYLSFLVLIPLIVSRDDKTVRRHISNGLVLLIGEVIWWIIQVVLALVLPEGLEWLRSLLAWLGNLTFFVFAVWGIVYAALAKEDKIPVLDSIRILK